MKLHHGVVLLLTFFLFACQPSTSSKVTILDNGNVITLQTSERVPSRLLQQAGIQFNTNDRALVNGVTSRLDDPITEDQSPIVLQLRRAVTVTLVTPAGEKQIESAAFNVGEMLSAAPYWLHAGDKISAQPSSPLSLLQSPVVLLPAQTLTVSINGKQVQVSGSASTVGEALSQAGIPLLGLDYSVPAEKEPLPADGQIKVVRVAESVVLAQKPIPFTSETQASAEVPLDQTQVIQPGETGLSMQRIRIRYENGSEVSRVTENATVVRPPKTRILGYGTKIEIKTATVDGVQIEYWRAVQMWAVSYSPCRSGGDRCYSGTSSGKSLKKGMVALRYDWYLAMGGQPLYIPGYGFATVEDVCGGCKGQGKPFIDLGYSDNDWEPWSSWVTVYFLTPVPSNVIYILE